MNQLKYILSINVPRRVPSSVRLVVPPRSHANEGHLRRRTAKLAAPRTEQTHVYAKTQERKATSTLDFPRSKLKTTMSSHRRLLFDRRSPFGCVATPARHHSSCQFVRYSCSSASKRHRRRWKDTESEDGKSTKTETGVKEHAIVGLDMMPSFEKDYATIVPKYSNEMSNKKNSTRIGTSNRNTFGATALDSRSNVDTHLTIRRSHPLSKKFNQVMRFNSNASCERSGPIDRARIIKGVSDSKLQSAATTKANRYTKSFTQMVANYSRDSYRDTETCSGNNEFCGSRNSLTSPITSTRNYTTKSVEAPGNLAQMMNMKMSSRSVERPPASVAVKQTDWLKKVENALKDLRNVTMGKETRSSSTQEVQHRTLLDSITEKADWLDRVTRAHKRKIKEKAKNMRTILPSEVTTDSEISKADSNVPHHIAIRNVSLEKKPTSNLRMAETITNETNESFKNNLSRGKATSNAAGPPQQGKTPPKHGTITTPVPKAPANQATLSNSSKVELRMVPSTGESLVSINVGTISSKQVNPTNSNVKELSVMVASGNAKRPDSQRQASPYPQGVTPKGKASNMGLVRISIDEKTMPVKQLELRINGKPVSEVKTITARTEKLEVVSSMDKIEIRIPFTQEEQTNAVQGVSNVSQVRSPHPKTASSTTDTTLNLQVSANLSETMEGPVVKQEPQTVPKSRTPKPRGPKIHYVFNPENGTVATTIGSPRADKAPKPANVGIRHQSSPPNERRTDEAVGRSKSDPNTKTKSTPVHIGIGEPAGQPAKQSVDNMQKTNQKQTNASGAGDVGKQGIQTAKIPEKASTAKQDTSVSTTSVPGQIGFTQSANSPFRRPINSKIGDRSMPPPISTTGTDNKSPDQRTPSRMIPWWSSDDAFTKIKKANSKQVTQELEAPHNTDKTGKTFLTRSKPFFDSPSSSSTRNPSGKSPKGSSDPKSGMKVSASQLAPERIERGYKSQFSSAELHTKPVGRLVRSFFLPGFKSMKSNIKIDTKTAAERVHETSSKPIIPIKETSNAHVNVSKKIETDKEQDGSALLRTLRNTEKAPSSHLPSSASAYTKQGISPQEKVLALNTLKTEVESFGSKTKIVLPRSTTQVISRPHQKIDAKVAKGNKSGDGNSKGKAPPPKKTSIQDILDSMKPIEKRKDGTLIDFGVKVPSRRKPERAKGRVKDTSSFTARWNEVKTTKQTIPGKGDKMQNNSEKSASSVRTVIDNQILASFKKNVKADESSAKDLKNKTSCASNWKTAKIKDTSALGKEAKSKRTDVTLKESLSKGVPLVGSKETKSKDSSVDVSRSIAKVDKEALQERKVNPAKIQTSSPLSALSKEAGSKKHDRSATESTMIPATRELQNKPSNSLGLKDSSKQTENFDKSYGMKSTMMPTGLRTSSNQEAKATHVSKKSANQLRIENKVTGARTSLNEKRSATNQSSVKRLESKDNGARENPKSTEKNATVKLLSKEPTLKSKDWKPKDPPLKANSSKGNLIRGATRKEEGKSSTDSKNSSATSEDVKSAKSKARMSAIVKHSTTLLVEEALPVMSHESNELFPEFSQNGLDGKKLLNEVTMFKHTVAEFNDKEKADRPEKDLLYSVWLERFPNHSHLCK